MTAGSDTPVPQAASDLLGEMATATQTLALAALRLEMEGLNVLFGGTSAPRTEAEQRAEAAETEAGFDNMPI